MKNFALAMGMLLPNLALVYLITPWAGTAVFIGRSLAAAVLTALCCAALYLLVRRTGRQPRWRVIFPVALAVSTAALLSTKAG